MCSNINEIGMSLVNCKLYDANRYRYMNMTQQQFKAQQLPHHNKENSHVFHPPALSAHHLSVSHWLLVNVSCRPKASSMFSLEFRPVLATIQWPLDTLSASGKYQLVTYLDWLPNRTSLIHWEVGTSIGSLCVITWVFYKCISRGNLS